MARLDCLTFLKLKLYAVGICAHGMLLGYGKNIFPHLHI